MNRLKRNLIFDFNYLRLSKAPIIIICLIIGICVIFSFFQYQYVNSTYDEYIQALNFENHNETNIQEIISDNYSIIENADGTTSIENPLAYYHELMGKSLFTTSTEYSTSHILELGLLIFPMLFSTIGIILAIIDKKNKIYKHKILRYGRKNYILSKLISFIYISLSILVLFIVINKICTYLLSFFIEKNIDTNSFSMKLTSGNSIIVQVIIIYLITITYLSIGFMLGICTQNGIISIGIMSLYIYLVPIISKYEIKNCCYVLMKNNFDFNGLINISSYKKIDYPIICIMMLLLYLLLSNLISILVTKFRQAYK